MTNRVGLTTLQHKAKRSESVNQTSHWNRANARRLIESIGRGPSAVGRTSEDLAADHTLSLQERLTA